MLPTEPQVINWLYNNYPTLLMLLTSGSLATYAALKLNKFFTRIEALEAELMRQKGEWLQVKTKVAQLVLTHCKRHSDDMDILMRVESDDGE